MSADKYPSIFSRQMEAIVYVLWGQISKINTKFFFISPPCGVVFK